jgi:hypothetical protein
MTAPVLPTEPPAPAAEANGQDEAPRDSTEKWAICCSGGGIRSASYCLGALQRLGQANFLDKTRLILGVSGGSYIAASRALVAHGLGRDAEPPAYAPGTPEEQHLRDNTRYLAPDAKTLLAGVLSLLLGVAVTLVLVLTPVFAAAHVWGWILRSAGVLTYTTAAHSGTPQWTASVTGVTWWIWPVIAAGVTLVIFLWWWATLIPGPRQHEGHSQAEVKALGWAAFLTLILALALLAVPELIAWLSGSHTGALKTVLDDLGFGAGAGAGTGPAWTPAALTGFVMAVVAVSQSAQKALAKYNLLQTPAAAQAPNAPSAGFGATVAGYLRTLLLPWLASVLLLLAGFVAALRWVRDGAAAGFTGGQVWVVIGALAVMLIARILTDVNRISLHDFYRWRLASAYAVKRKTDPRGGKPAPFGVDNSPGTCLSDLTDDGGQPGLVICTTANINAEREVPVGRGGLSFTFDAYHATLRGPDPDNPVRARTKDYEALVGKRRFTLFDASAISGAAFSPLMGAATQQAHRILFTATDLRLGVWLPHPAVVDAAAREIERQKGKNDPWWRALWLLLWYVLPHFGWQHSEQEPGGREARLWAHVLWLRRDQTGFRRFLGGLLYQAMQPTLGMLYAEAAGHTSYRCTWMCVTDGGHYDNLGLVEALQRRTELGVTHILVLDASGDKANTWFTLGGSIALARSDAATEITLDPTTMIGPLEPGMSALVEGQVVRPWASGTFTAEGRQSGAQPSQIVVCKLGWWTGAPWDVCAYAAGHPSYPTESTLDQLYDSTEFDAYRELGWSAVDLAITNGELPADATRQAQPASGTR